MHIFCRELCKSLEGKSDHFSTTDPDHNDKLLFYHIIVGSCLPVAGIHVIDAQMLQVSGISKNLWRPKDFASDILVLKLASSETVKKLTGIIMIGDYLETFFSLCTSLYFLRLGLYAVNTKVLASNMRVYFLWCCMILITSIKNICIITKSNIVTSTIGMSFLENIIDVPRPIHATYEPSDNT